MVDQTLVMLAAATFFPPLTFALLLLSRPQFSNRTIQLMLGLSAGILLGVSFSDILPEAYEAASSLSVPANYVSGGIAAGFIGLLLLETGAANPRSTKPIEPPSRILSSRQGLIGISALTVHGFMDGFVIPLSFAANTLVGIAVTLAIVIHQIPDTFSAFSIAAGATSSRNRSLLTILVTAVDTPIGIGVGILALSLGSIMIPIGLGFIAGTFVYVSAAELVPQLRRSSQGLHLPLSIVAGFTIVAATLSLLTPA